MDTPTMRLLLLALVLQSLAVLLPAQTAPAPQPTLQELVGTIQTELEVHGNRVLGHEAYRWSTRLDRFDACRVEFSVRVVSNLADSTVRTESVNFSLGAIDPYSTVIQKNWLELPCTGREDCIFSTSTCKRTSKDGVVTDCATASQKRVDTFALQLDGDAAAASRLDNAFRAAVSLCREPQTVTF